LERRERRLCGGILSRAPLPPAVERLSFLWSRDEFTSVGIGNEAAVASFDSRPPEQLSADELCARIRWLLDGSWIANQALDELVRRLGEPKRSGRRRGVS
jgi:hypothetical protein